MSPRTQAVLIGGAFIGVLSAVPIVSTANCCCLWIIGGGVVTAYLLQQGQPSPIDFGDAALVGGLAGVCGAFVYAVVSVPVQLITRPVQDRLTDLLRGNADIPPEVVRIVEKLTASGATAILFGFVFMLVAGAFFATLGGLLGGLIFRRGGPPSAPSPGPTTSTASPGRPPS